MAAGRRYAARLDIDGGSCRVGVPPKAARSRPSLESREWLGGRQS
jgi:hypothetical protein